MARRLFGLVLAASALTGACKQGGPSEAELDAKLEAMLAKRASAPEKAADAKGGGGEAPKHTERAESEADETVETACLPNEATKKAKATAKLLLEIEKLMADYAPKLPQSPEAPEKCMTKVAEANDPAGAKVEKLLESDYKKRRDEAARKTAEILRHFEEVDLPLAWSWVSAIVPGHEFAIAPGVLVKEPTELMKRLETRPDLKVDAEQFCVVQQAEARNGSVELTCRGPRRSDRSFFYVEAEAAAGAAGGPLAAVGVGDLVSFSGHLVLTHKPHASRELPTWHFLKVPADGVKVAAESTCCHGAAK